MCKQRVFGLKAKMYSITYENKQKVSAKGVCRYAQTSLNCDVFRNVLLDGGKMRSLNIRIGARKHVLQTIQNQKISLSAFDDTRFILEDGVNCLPIDHLEIRDIEVYREIAVDDDWGYDDQDDSVRGSTTIERFSPPNWSQLVHDFHVSPPSIVPSLSNFNPNRHSADFVESEALHQSIDLFSQPDPGFNQRAYSNSEWDEVADSDDMSTVFSLPRCPNPFIDYEAVESLSFRNFYDSDSETINYTLENELPSSPILFELAPKRRRVILISSDSDEF